MPRGLLAPGSLRCGLIWGVAIALGLSLCLNVILLVASGVPDVVWLPCLPGTQTYGYADPRVTPAGQRVLMEPYCGLDDQFEYTVDTSWLRELRGVLSGSDGKIVVYTRFWGIAPVNGLDGRDWAPFVRVACLYWENPMGPSE